MPLDTHSFLGAMDLDSPDHVIPKGRHRTARNGIFRGQQPNMRFESVVGTTLQDNPLLPVIGVNKNIGWHYDAVNQRVIFANFNSSGSHGWYIFNTLTKTFQRLIETGINTVGDPLAFTASGYISSIDIRYGDGTEGDLLFYVDSLKRPSKFNIQRILAGTLNPIKREYLEVIKAPFPFKPEVTYENDTTVNSNNLINSLWEFAGSQIYDDFEESVISTGSITPTPTIEFDPTKNIDKSKNARISIYLPTGDANVKKIRVYGRQTINGTTSGWLIIDTLIKADLGIPDNTFYRYLFFNNGNYPAADPKYTALPFDYVPLEANAGVLLDGTTAAYAGIKEGYDFVNPTLSLSAVNSTTDIFTISGVLFFAFTNGTFTSGQPNIEIVLTGAGTNDGSGNPIILDNTPEFLFVRAKSSGTDISFSYDNSSFTNIATILANLASAAVVAGWNVVSTGTNNLIVYYPTGSIELQSAFIKGTGPSSSSAGLPRYAHYPESNYSYGVKYYDAWGRTNGVISNIQGNISTLPFDGNIGSFLPEITLDLSGFTPPSWARYYHVVRTNTKTFDKHLCWVSNSAFSNIGESAPNLYAYIGIGNIDDYNQTIKSTSGVVSYEYTSGDRIRFYGVYAVNTSFTPLSFDYAILGVVTNPVINGIVQEGRFIQISYPTADISGTFKFDGSVDFQNYQILLYSYKSNDPTTSNVYYEVAQRYGIGNAGTVSAFHMGNVADNIVKVIDGDIFTRTRNVPCGNTYYLNAFAEAQGDRYATNILNTDKAPIVTSNYTVSSQTYLASSLANGAAPTFANGTWFENTGGSDLTIRLRGTVPVTVDGSSFFEIFAKITNAIPTTTVITVLPKSSITGVAQPLPTVSSLLSNSGNTLIPNTAYQFPFDSTFIVPAHSKVFFITGNGLSVVNLHQTNWTMRLDVFRNIAIQIFEPSYSDIYDLRTNYDNRPSVIDATATQAYYSTLFRFSQPFEPNTNINNSNRFYDNNFDEFDKSYGDVIRMRVRQRELRIFQKRRCGHTLIYAKFIKDNAGTNTLVTTDAIITPNNVEYFEGEFGIGDQAMGLISSSFDDYFPDPVKGYFLRLSLDGIKPISEEFNTQTFAGQNLPNYLNDYTYQFGGNAIITGCYNFLKDRDSEVIFTLQGGTSGGGNITGQSLAFDERKNSWTSFYDFAPDSILCAENQLYSFFNGKLYSHDNTTAYANFYGTQYKTSITSVFNDLELEKKTWISVSAVSNVIWNCPLIYTQLDSYPGQRQESNLIDEDFALLEGQYHASFLNDIHSIKGLINGDSLKGTYCVIQFQPTDGSKYSFLAAVSVKYIQSPLTTK